MLFRSKQEWYLNALGYVPSTTPGIYINKLYQMDVTQRDTLQLFPEELELYAKCCSSALFPLGDVEFCAIVVKLLTNFPDETPYNHLSQHHDKLVIDLADEHKSKYFF